MAQTNYSKSFGKAVRRDGVQSRDDYNSNAIAKALRGIDLPHSKFSEDDVLEIRSAIKQRESMRQYIKDNLSNEALARKFNVHHRTIERVIQRETWVHLL
jgi:predicted DNA-binding transcriptional regulator YafY